MKFFYDTEFIEDEKTIDLISIGMVTEDGKEFYRIRSSFDKQKFLRSEWLVKNVLPKLPYSIVGDDLIINHKRPDHALVMSGNDIAQQLKEFIRENAKFDDVELWAWYGAYDHVALAQLYGRMIDLPSIYPMYTMDLRQVVHRICKEQGVKSIPLPQQEGRQHKAINDARYNLELYRYLKDTYGIPE